MKTPDSPLVRKHANGCWQPMAEGKLLCGGFFVRKKDAMAMAEQHRDHPFTDWFEVVQAVKQHGGFMVM